MANETEQNSNIYEAGYHLVPTLAEEAILAESDKIKSLITSFGGEIISEGLPTMGHLAYSVSKTVKAVKSNYGKSYFGWVKFSMAPDELAKLKEALDASDTVLRHIVISTVKESTLMADKEKRPTTRPEPAKEKENEGIVGPSSKDIDKSIDDLVIN